MINFKNSEDRAPSALILLSMVILAGTLAYMVLVPPPSAAGVAKGRDLSRRKLENEIATTKTRTKQMTAATRPWLWKGNAETITSSVLANLTEQANRKSLKMAAFRPQKPQQLDGVTELPFSVQLSGPYPVVRAMVDFLNAPSSKLAVQSVQVASSDAATSAVTATLGFSAYTESAEPPASNGKTEAPHG